MSTKIFSLKDRFKSFKHAIEGFKLLFIEEHNARVHLMASLTAVLLGFILNISYGEWFVVVISIVLVFSMELMNSAVENTADAITKEHNLFIKKAKDMAAAAVFILSVVALTCGIVIFIPKIWQLLF